MRRVLHVALALAALSGRAVAAEPAPPTTEPPAPVAPAPTTEPSAAPAPVATEPSAPVATTPSAAPAPVATENAAEPSRAPAKPPKVYGDLQSPELVNTRYSAYSLQRHDWAFDIGALGIGGNDVFANLGATYGFGGGFEIEMNLAHLGVGLANVGVGWHFLDTRYIDLGARVGIGYGRGQWFWLAQGAAKSLVSKIDLINLPLELAASSIVTRWLELDLAAHYDYVKTFGSGSDDSSIFVKAQLAVSQVFLRPGARVFISDRTALELFAKLPLYSAVPLKQRTIKIPFSDMWSIEAGVRSRLVGRLFGNVRLHYGSIADVLYGARLYPSFDVEVRF